MSRPVFVPPPSGAEKAMMIFWVVLATAALGVQSLLRHQKPIDVFLMGLVGLASGLLLCVAISGYTGGLITELGWRWERVTPGKRGFLALGAVALAASGVVLGPDVLVVFRIR